VTKQNRTIVSDKLSPTLKT